jgi:hypothetical protein
MPETNPQPRGSSTQRDHPDHTVSACVQQWQDAELAMTVARRYFQSWLQAGQQDTPVSVTRYAYQTHEALHAALHAISLLIETLRVEAAGCGGLAGGGCDHCTRR